MTTSYIAYITLSHTHIETSREQLVTTNFISFSSGVATPLCHVIATWVGELVSQQYIN